MKPFIIGIDFDNTIVCYDHVFYQTALERGLIESDFPKNKERIRNYLRRQNQEDKWTEMQGYVYGKKMESAHPFPGVLDFIRKTLENEWPVYIVSHKTQYPYAGPQYDLHAAAYAWLEQYQFFSTIGLSPSHVYFEDTKIKKCAKIAAKTCTHFIDDLPELLLDENFPKQVKKLLFSPIVHGENNAIDIPDSLQCFISWHDIHQHFFVGDRS